MGRPLFLPGKDDMARRETVRFTTSTVLDVTTQGLQYLDDTGTGQFIDFPACRHTWVSYVNTSPDFTATNLTEHETSCVAWCDAGAAPLYIEFFTEPRTRFEFFAPRTLLERLVRRPGYGWSRHVRDLHQRIIEVGWTAYDLS